MVAATKDALLEIGCEELPASLIPAALKQLEKIAQNSLAENQLSCRSIAVHGTPRRLAICLHELMATARDHQRIVTGPSASKARDTAGQWSAAALGFARKHDLSPEQLIIQDGRLCATLRLKEVATRVLLATLFPQWISSLKFPKTMVWEPTHFQFPRPIRWFVALYGQEVVSFTLAGVRSSRWTQGLRYQSAGKVAVTQAGKYVGLLKNQCILVEPAARREAIRKLADQAVRRVQGQVLLSDALLEEVTNLVEHPVAIGGNFDPAYLELPHEVLVACLEHHQKFFPVAEIPSSLEGEGFAESYRLLPHFIGIRNGVSVHQELVKEGYERVLMARLADARFFYNQDRKTSLASKVDALRGVTLQQSLGSLFDKKERVKKLLDAVCQRLAWQETERSRAMRAAELCKADLVTEMVGEFPELQGVIGRLYAQADGEEAVVAAALQEHYWPLTLSGELPAEPVASVVALADKADTLASDFAIGLIPTGSADPYGLRRAAVGILRILETRGWPLPIEWLIKQALSLQPAAALAGRENTRQELIQFTRQRLSALLEERSFRADEIDAVLALPIDILPATLGRLKALHEIRTGADFGQLSVVFKRAANIVRQAAQKGALDAGAEDDGPSVRPDLLKEPSEQALYQAYRDARDRTMGHLQEGAYGTALESLATLRDPLGRFFEGVMVLTEDASLRHNRLALLSGIVGLFLHIADFSKLQNNA